MCLPFESPCMRNSCCVKTFRSFEDSSDDSVIFGKSKTAKTSAMSVDGGDTASADASRKHEGLGVSCGVKALSCATLDFKCDRCILEALEGVSLGAEYSSHGSFRCVLVAGVTRVSNLTALGGVCGASRSWTSSWLESGHGNVSASSKPASEKDRFKALLDSWRSVQEAFGDGCVF
jgi:hypothetical protein